MKKLIIAGLLISLLILSGCEVHSTDSLNVYTQCEDDIVCFSKSVNNLGGLFCFIDDKVLLEKYCGKRYYLGED